MNCPEATVRSLAFRNPPKGTDMNHSVKSDEELMALLERTMRRVSVSAPDMEFSTTTGNQRWIATAAAATVLVVGVGATGVALNARRNASSPPAAIVAGPSESSLVRVDDVSLSTSIVKPGAVALQLADGQRLTFGVVGMPYFDGYAQAVTIQIGAASNGRFLPAGAEVAAGAEPELGGNDTVVFWAGLPASVARVEFHPAAGATTWQTPAEGIAAFPVAAHSPDDTLIGYTAAGDEVQRISWSAATQVGSTSTGDDPAVRSDYSSVTAPPSAVLDVNVAMVAGLTQLQEDRYRAFGNDTMRSCLSERGNSAWTACIESTDSAVKQYLKDLAASLTADNAA
jgi:hypothetical protein